MESGPPPAPTLRFLRLAEIAVGATARVELCRVTDGAMAGRHVVVKRLHPHVAEDPQFVDMFRDEAWMTGSLRNPHVVEVVGFATDDEGPYLAVEFVRGVSLARLMKTVFETREMFTERLVVHLGACICNGLHAAHELRSPAGELLWLVHRDVTPSNVLVGFDGQVKLADFGMAKAKLRLTKTVTGLLKGQPYYMAPEQVQGRTVDRRADIFAVGVLLFELFAGRRPWDAANDLEAMRASCDRPPADLAQLRPRIDPALVRLVNRCLEKSPGKRYQTALQLYEVLSKWLDVHGYRTDNEVALARFIRRNAMRQMRWFDRALAGHFVAGAERLDRIGNDPPMEEEDATRPDVQPPRPTPSQPPPAPPRLASGPPTRSARDDTPEILTPGMLDVEETDAELFDTDDGPTIIQRSRKARQVLRRLSDVLVRPRERDGEQPPSGAVAPEAATRVGPPVAPAHEPPEDATVRDQPVPPSGALAADGATAGPTAALPLVPHPGRVAAPDPAAPPLPASAPLPPAPTAVLALPALEPAVPMAGPPHSWATDIALAAQGLAAQADEAAEHARRAQATAAAAARAAAVAQQAAELARQTRRDEAANLLREAYRLQAAIVRGEADPVAPPDAPRAPLWPETVPAPDTRPWAALRERVEGWIGPEQAPLIAMAVAAVLLLLSLILAIATC